MWLHPHWARPSHVNPQSRGLSTTLQACHGPIPWEHLLNRGSLFWKNSNWWPVGTKRPAHICLFSRKAFLSHYGFSSHKQSKGDSIVISKCLNEVIAISSQPWLNIGWEAAISLLLLMRKLRHTVAKHGAQRTGKRGIRSWTHLLGVEARACHPHIGVTAPWTYQRLNTNEVKFTFTIQMNCYGN